MGSSPADVAHAAHEFIHQPDLRTISSFFSGQTTLLAIYFLILQLRTFLLFRHHHHVADACEKGRTDPDQHHDHRFRAFRILGVLLNLAVLASTTGSFVSLLSFSAGSAAASCGEYSNHAHRDFFGADLRGFSPYVPSACLPLAFAIAWTGLSAQLIRSLSFFQLSYELSHLHASRAELWILWVATLGSLGAAFAAQALGEGFTVPLPIPQENGDGLVGCYKAHPLVPALINSAINILIELYLLVRFYTLIVPEFLRAKHRREALMDSRFGRAGALVLLDVVTILPNALCVNTAADVIPFSLACIVVLVAFNYTPLVNEDIDVGTSASLSSPTPSSSSNLATLSRRPTRATFPAVDSDARSRRSSRSAIPGDGGYGFESNVVLRSGAVAPTPVQVSGSRVASTLVLSSERAQLEAPAADDESSGRRPSTDSDPDRERRRPRAGLPPLIIPSSVTPAFSAAAAGAAARDEATPETAGPISDTPGSRIDVETGLLAVLSGAHSRRPSATSSPTELTPTPTPTEMHHVHVPQEPRGTVTEDRRTTIAVTTPQDVNGVTEAQKMDISSPVPSSIVYPFSMSGSRSGSGRKSSRSSASAWSSPANVNASASRSGWPAQPKTPAPNVPLPLPPLPVPTSSGAFYSSSSGGGAGASNGGPARYRDIRLRSGSASGVGVPSSLTPTPGHGGTLRLLPSPPAPAAAGTNARHSGLPGPVRPVLKAPSSSSTPPGPSYTIATPHVQSRDYLQLRRSVPSSLMGVELTKDVQGPRPSLSTSLGSSVLSGGSIDEDEDAPLHPRTRVSNESGYGYGADLERRDTRRTQARSSMGPMTGSSLETSFEIVEIPPRVPSFGPNVLLSGRDGGVETK